MPHSTYRPGETAEGRRLAEDGARAANWKRWGPYLAERQWSTVREDYSQTGECWEYLPHDHARSRAYRWGEDGLLGFTDRQCRMCFAVALWNGRDPILKERLFGLTNAEGNRGEDVKEEWFYLESTPTHSYARALYKYPQAEFPYARLVEENRRRSRLEPEFELADAGVFEGGRYFDVEVQYAKQSPEDVLARVLVTNRGPEPAVLHVLPTFWFRNTWSWDCTHEGCEPRPRIRADGVDAAWADHRTLGRYLLEFGPSPGGGHGPLWFTENDTNQERLFGAPNATPYVKDAFHRRLIDANEAAVNPSGAGTKVCAWHRIELAPGETRSVEVRWVAEAESRLRWRASPLRAGSTDEVFEQRARESASHHEALLDVGMTPEERVVAEQACAGLLWGKQFYHYVVEDWLDGDPGHPPPPEARQHGRNAEWRHLHARDVISMPDKWEYPWFAAWDLAFHMIPFAMLDGDFAKSQLSLMLREWYMHPNGQIPAYEFAFGDVNPPVHAWAAWRVYKLTAPKGRRDRDFLESVFQKLLLNFTWWVNRKDAAGKNLFSGGFLGLDNIGVFDRSKPLPGGGTLQQADGTAWMAFYSLTMLAMALELAHDGQRVRPAYEDMASKFLEHFVQIAEAMNTLGGTGLWDEEDGFYHDQLEMDGRRIPLRTRSMVGLLPLIAVEVLDEDLIMRLPGFRKRLGWFVSNKHGLDRGIALGRSNTRKKLLLAIPTRDRLRRVLQYLLDESEFLSPFGIRSLSKFHEKHPFVFECDGSVHRVGYVPGESTTYLFGGNSNWRGPVWFPVNYLIGEALERYHHFYGDEFTVECPTGSGRHVTLREAALEIERRLASLFLPGSDGRRPAMSGHPVFSEDPHWRGLVQFHEYFHAETGRGCGANHQTGWTALVLRYLGDVARRRHGG
ncbi:MAG: glucosidase [Verrucomicrobiota bacterium]|jgi:hypothetical protein